MEQVEVVRPARELGVHDGARGDVAEPLGERASLLDRDEHVVVAVRDEDRRSVGLDVVERRRRERLTRPVDRAVVAEEADGARDRGVGVLEAGWKALSFGVSAAVAARWAPAELPATNTTEESAPYSAAWRRAQAIAFFASTR